jgi:hypothetical protein
MISDYVYKTSSYILILVFSTQALVIEIVSFHSSIFILCPIRNGKGFFKEWKYGGIRLGLRNTWMLSMARILSLPGLQGRDNKLSSKMKYRLKPQWNSMIKTSL